MAKKRTPVGDPHSPAPEAVEKSEHEQPTSLTPPPRKSKSKSKSNHKSKREYVSDSESKSKSKSKSKMDFSVQDTESKKSREKKRKSDKGDASATTAVSASPAFAAPAVHTESKKSRKKKLKFDNDDVTANPAASVAVASPALAAPAVDTEPKKSKKKHKSDAGDATSTSVVSAAVGATAAKTQVVSDPVFADTSVAASVVGATAHNDDVTASTAVTVAVAAPAHAAPTVGADSKKTRKKHKSDKGDVTSATVSAAVVALRDEVPAVAVPSIAGPSDGPTAVKAPVLSAPASGDTIVASPAHAGATSGGTERKLFERVWSENDEIAILEGMIAYAEKHDKYPMRNTEDFHSSIKKSIEVEGFSKTQLSDKVRRLKKKYMNNAAKAKYNPSKAHDQKAFLLSKKIWGKDVASVTPAVKQKRDSSTRGGVAVDVGILKTVLPGLPVAVIERGLELLSEEIKADLMGKWQEIFVSESDLVAKKKMLGSENASCILKALSQG